MNVHDLKTDSKAFHNTVVGNKRFEIRLNDRNFKFGDILILRETAFTGEQMRKHPSNYPFRYTGSFAVVRVTNLLHGPIYGLENGWCIMSVELNYFEVKPVADHEVVPGERKDS